MPSKTKVTSPIVEEQEPQVEESSSIPDPRRVAITSLQPGQRIKLPEGSPIKGENPFTCISAGSLLKDVNGVICPIPQSDVLIFGEIIE